MYLTRTIIFSLLTSLFFTLVDAQNSSLAFLDSTTSNFILGGVSTNILDKDDIEISLNQTLSTYWLEVFEIQDDFRRIINRRRATAFNQNLRLSYGFSNNRRWDLGALVSYNHYRDDENARSSPLQVFSDDELTGTTYRGLATAGLNLRVMPFESIPELVLQGSYQFPVGNKDDEQRRFIQGDRDRIDLTATYYNPLGNKTYYFLQGTWTVLLNELATTNLMSGYFYLIRSIANGRFYFYPGISYSFGFQKLKGRSYSTTTKYVFGGLGLQYQPRFNINFSLTFQHPLLLESGSEFVQINRSTYASLTLGVRAIINN